MLTRTVAIFAETAKIQADRKRCKTRWCMSFGIRVNMIWFGALELMCCFIVLDRGKLVSRDGARELF